MMLDADSCYRALRARDARFDGRFYVAVSSTGIYCRPICPVAPPKRAHVKFFATAEEAERAGFRPCRRCRPEAGPGTPAWRGSSATVARALRMIEAGELEALGFEAFAERLGMGTRQLRRLFVEHLGAPPLSVARTRRAHAAKRLLARTELPMNRIAAEAGFGSLRQFNDAVRRAYGKSPTELRRGELETTAPACEPIRLRLAARRPFDWDALLGFLAPRAIPHVEQVEGSRYRRVLEIDGRASFVEAEADAAAGDLELRLEASSLPDLLEISERARLAFDLRADAARISGDLARDPVLEPLVCARAGLRVPGAWDPFELTVRAVLGQQVSVAAATTLSGRLVRICGRPLASPRGAITHLFPTPAAIAATDLRELGVPRARAGTLLGLARAVASGALTLDRTAPHARVREQLSAIPGIGHWTVEYVAMRALGDPDAFPASDLGLRSALADRGNRPDADELEARAERWRPWRAYAALHLWTGASHATSRPRD